MHTSNCFPIQKIRSEALVYDKIFLGLIFCFPIFSLTIRHWLSGIYALLILLALGAVFRKREKLFKEEKILLALTIVLVLSFFLSASLNHWSVNSIRRIGTVTKFIFFLPFYFQIRRYDNLPKLLVSGIILASIVLGINAVFDIVVDHYPNANGIYGPIIFGDLSVLYFGILLLLILIERRTFPSASLPTIAVLFALVAAVLSGSRNAWIAAVFTIFLIPFLSAKSIQFKRIILFLVPLTLLFSAIIAFYQPLDKRLFLAINQAETFMKEGAPRNIPLANNSTGIRLEQWRSALQLYKEAPFFGYGGGNAAKQINRLVKEGRAHPDLYNPASETNIGGVHSTYFGTLMTEGIVGLLIMLAFLLYPLYVFIRLRKTDLLLSSLGILFSLNFMIFGTTEDPFVADNFTSVYLVFLGIFFSAAVHKLHSRETG